MSTTISGCNRDPCESGVAVSIDSFGVNLVTKDDDIISIPPGNGIIQIQLKLVDPSVPLAGLANNLEVVVDDGTTETVVLSVPKAQLNSSPNVSLVGTDASPIANASNSEISVKLRADTDDFGGVGPVVCALIKYKSIPVLI
jgi:hypothetical protein